MKQKRFGSVLAAVLSGGASSRMGRPKDRLLLPGGKNFLQHQIDTLLLLSREVLVAGPEIPLLLEETERVHFIKDGIPACGPLSGIEAVLASGLAPAFLIVACDQALLDEDTLLKLIPDNPELPCFFDCRKYDGLIQPLPGYYPVKWLPEIRDALRRNRLSLKALIQQSQVELKEADEQTAQRLRGANTESELQEILKEFTSLTERN